MRRYATAGVALLATMSMLWAISACREARPGSAGDSPMAQMAAPKPADPPQWTRVMRWTGNGIRHTEPFRVASGEWRINWSTSNEVTPGAGRFQVEVHTESGELLTKAVDTRGLEHDTTPVRGSAGVHYLVVTASGVDWVVEVEDQR